ncbi:MAG TPA: tripartite tricarboxylate transporter substrate binding protein [Candidatus Sulfotelmatobacter sp.]|nr:tripartite tricarboxylate transporter substrate binding protein [Candidatus Sulfotelmatobacter sp.]
MTIPFFLRLVGTVCIGVLMLDAGAAHAAYPERPVHIVVPFPPGGGTDVIARVLAQKLSAGFAQQVVVENRPGAGAMIGADHVAKALPDGYTLLLGTSAELTISPGLYDNVPYDPVADFAPIDLLGTTPIVLVAHPTFPANRLDTLIEQARQSPGRIAIGSGGQGAAPDLAAELLRRLTGIDVIIVPYKGAGDALTDVVAGQVGATFTTVAGALPLTRSGSIKALAIIAAQRSTLMPDVPSAAEQGVPDYEVVTWFGLFAPAKTPHAVIDTLATAVAAAMRDPEIAARLVKLGIEPSAAAPDGEGLRRRIATEAARWRRLIHDAGIKPE